MAIPGFDTPAAQRDFRASVQLNLTALVAAIQAFPADRQPQVLREWLELMLDRLAAMEDDHQSYLGECVLLAVDNMQDARLHVVEQRLQQLEDPDGPTFFELLKGTALSFAFTLAGWLAVEWIGEGVLALFLAAESAAPAARAAATTADEALLKSAHTKVTSLAQLRDRRAALVRERDRLAAALQAVSRSGLPSQAMTPVLLEAIERTGVLAAEMDAIHGESLIAGMSMAEGVEVSTQARLNFEQTQAGDTTLARAQWRRFLDDAQGALALTPAQTAAELLVDYVQGPAGRPAGGAAPDQGGLPFLASTPAGRVLTAVAEQRRAIRTDYVVLRAALGSRSDSHLTADSLVTTLAGTVAALVPLLDTYLALQDSARPVLVRGFEAALWWAYLKENGMLDHKPTTRLFAGLDHKPGDIVNGYLIKSAAQPPFTKGAQYDTEYYRGVQYLNEGQTEYLYSAFAAPYFGVGGHANDLPFAFDPKNYVGVLDKPRDSYAGFMTNADRQSRLDQMRLMVVLFFERLPTEHNDTGTTLAAAASKALALDVSPGAWTALFPGVTMPQPPEDPRTDGSAIAQAEAAEPDLTALLSDSKVLARTLYEALRSRLADAATQLDSDIETYGRLNRGEIDAGDTTRGFDEEQYYNLIQSEQDAIRDDDPYGQALRAAQELDPAEAEDLKAYYEDWVDGLLSWDTTPTTTTVPIKWKFFPDRPPAP